MKQGWQTVPVRKDGGAYKFTMPEANVTVETTYKKVSNISLTTPQHGKVELSATTVKEGETVSMTITPDWGYRVQKITIKDAKNREVHYNEPAWGSSAHTFTMPASDVTVTVTFTRNF